MADLIAEIEAVEKLNGKLRKLENEMTDLIAEKEALEKLEERVSKIEDKMADKEDVKKVPVANGTILPRFAVLLVVVAIFIFSCVELFGSKPSGSRNPVYTGFESCDENWILRNTSEILSSIERDLFGQHLAKLTVYGALVGHTTHQPSKPLVLSFHGPTGTGKNYVSNMIAQSWFLKGTNSRYVHYYSGTIHFPFNSQVDEYKTFLKNSVYDAAKICKHSLFILDEMDDFPPGVLDSIWPYLDYHDEVDGVDFRNTIFIFLSNIGEEGLIDITKEFLPNARLREDIRFVQSEQILIRSVGENGGGLRNSRIMGAHLINHFVPFLPLEKSHVRDCIRAEMFRRRIAPSENVVDKVIDCIQFYGPNDQLSVKGCKNVVEKISLFMTKEKMEKGKLEL